MAERKVVSQEKVLYPRQQEVLLVHTNDLFTIALLQYVDDTHVLPTIELAVLFLKTQTEEDTASEVMVLPATSYIDAVQIMATVMNNWYEGKHDESLQQPLTLRPLRDVEVILAKRDKGGKLKRLRGLSGKPVNPGEKEFVETDLERMKNRGQIVQLSEIVEDLKKGRNRL